MITHIRMKNFKSWEDSDEVKLAPLTGFFGTNSSGKSSLLQMLLLLKQTVGREEILFFGDEKSLVNLGNFREVIHGHKEEELLELEFGGRLLKPLTIRTLQEIDKYRQRYEFATSDIDSFTFDTAIRGNASGMSIDSLSYTVGPEAIDKIKWENGNLYYGNKFAYSVSGTNCYGRRTKITDAFLSPLSSVFENLFKHVYPLGPSRIQPKRLYHWEGEDPESVGQNGENMIDSLLNARVDQRTTPYKGEDILIEERVSAWLRKMDLAYSFSIKRADGQADRDFDVLIQKGPDSAKVTLADMGYGLSQFLPVLVHCYYVPPGSTLILEQPGVHLHPKAQADIADLLIEVIIERNLQILIESHSEHLLNRLQRRVAEEKIAADQTALYFCRHIDGASKIDKLDMDEFGNITNWPESFFGDEMGDLFAMTEAQRERQKRETELIEGTTIAPSK